MPLLLHLQCEGVDGSTTFTNSATSGITVTSSGTEVDTYPKITTDITPASGDACGELIRWEGDGVGKSSHLIVDDYPLMDITQDFTFQIYFNLNWDNFSKDTNLWQKVDNAWHWVAIRYVFNYGGTSFLDFIYGGMSSYQYKVNWTHTKDTWHKFVLIREGDILRFYIDNVLISTQTIVDPKPYAYGSDARIGYTDWHSPENNPASARLYFDEVKWWNEAITNTTVSAEAVSLTFAVNSIAGFSVDTYSYGIGAFIGNVDYSGGTYIQNCYSSMTITISGQPAHQVGGFIGTIQDSDNTLKIYNCYSVGVIDAETLSSHVGGFIGYDGVLGISNFNNCAWYTGSESQPLGNTSGTLSSLGYGWDEDTASDLWYGLTAPVHPVYYIINATKWDFFTPIWYDHVTTSAYPDFEPTLSSWTVIVDAPITIITSPSPEIQLSPVIITYIFDPVVTSGCPQCGCLLLQEGERVRSDAIYRGRNFDHGAFKDDRYVRCPRCKFVCNLDRHLHAPRDSKLGYGITYTEQSKTWQ